MSSTARFQRIRSRQIWRRSKRSPTRRRFSISSCGCPIGVSSRKGEEIIPLFGPFGLCAQIGSAEYARPRRFRENLDKWLDTVRLLWPHCPARIGPDGQTLQIGRAVAVLPNGTHLKDHNGTRYAGLPMNKRSIGHPAVRETRLSEPPALITTFPP